MIYLHETTSTYSQYSKRYTFKPVENGKVVKHSKLLALHLLESSYLDYHYALIEDVTEKELSLKRSENKFLLVIGGKVFCVKNAKDKPIPKWFSSKAAALEFFEFNILKGKFLEHWGVDGYFYHGKNKSCGWFVPKAALINDLITSDFIEVFKNEK